MDLVSDKRNAQVRRDVAARERASGMGRRLTGSRASGMVKTLHRVGIAADHEGLELMRDVAGKLRESGYDVVEYGDRHSSKNDDYSDFIIPLAEAVARGDLDRGVAICGSGVGASVAANKVTGVRACLIHESFSAHHGVEDDNLNMICLSGLVLGPALAWEFVQTFLAAKFKGVDVRRLTEAGYTNFPNPGKTEPVQQE